MKHLKTYKIFESDDDIETFKDCFNDMRDEGFDVEFDLSSARNANVQGHKGEIIACIKKGDDETFNVDEVYNNGLGTAINYSSDLGLKLYYMAFFTSDDDMGLSVTSEDFVDKLKKYLVKGGVDGDDIIGMNLFFKIENKHLESYKILETFEDKKVGTYFYGGRTSILTRVEIKQTLDEIVDNLLELFDEYNIVEEPKGEYYGTTWEYGGNWEYTEDGKEDMVNRVIDSNLIIRNIKGKKFDQFVSDLNDLKKTIENRIGQELVIRPDKKDRDMVITTKEIGCPAGTLLNVSHRFSRDDDEDEDYELFESYETTPQEAKVSCEDILLDLVDDGFRAVVTVDGAWTKGSLSEYPKSWLKVVVSKITDVDPSDNEFYNTKVKFGYDDIKETVNRLNSYLSQLGFKPDDDFGSMVVRTEAVRNPNNFALVGIRSFANLWYMRDEIEK